MLGDVELSIVEGDNPKESVEVTEKPVENGQDVADHIKRKPATISITGIIVGEDASPKLQKLKKYQREGEILTYINRVAYHNVVIESIDTTHDSSISNGLKFSISLKHIRVAIGKQIDKTVNPTTKKADPKTQTQVKKKTNKGKQQTKKKNTSTEAKSKAKKTVGR